MKRNPKNYSSCLTTQRSRLSTDLLAFLFTGALAATAFATLPPFWHGNDDFGMSMIAEGYGLAAYPSPAILYSNVIYGYLIYSAPQIGDISRYSYVSIGLNILAIFFICRALLLLSANRLSALAVTLLIALLPLIFPRFTLLAGLLTLAGVLHIFVYLSERRSSDLVVLGILFFGGYLVRSGMFLLILIVSSALLPWKELAQRRVILATMGVVIAISAAMSVDWWYYQGPEWSNFRAFNSVRVPFSDYRAADYFLSSTDLLRDTSYSVNDIILLRNWWFVDPAISNPAKLSALLSRVNLSYYFTNTWTQAWRDLALLIEAPLVFVLVPAAASLVFAKHRVRLGVAWLPLGVAFVGLIVAGRSIALPYVIYMPLALLLSFGIIQIERQSLHFTIALLVTACAVGAAASLATRHARQMQEQVQMAGDLATIDKSKLYVVWSTLLPLESLYPVFGSMAAARQFRWYGLGVGSLAPFAMAHWKDAPGGLPARLASGDTVPILVDPVLIDNLSTYCAERLSTKLRIVDFLKLQTGTIFTVTCG